MRQCLTHPDSGYYTRQTTGGQDQFGTKGDFVTSPEISQIFGELVGIWVYAEWLAQGRKDKVQIIEVGPGRGTLMDDVLRVWQTPSGGPEKETDRALDDIKLQDFHQEHRNHLSHRSITLPAETAGKAAFWDRRSYQERYWLDRTVQVHSRLQD